MSSFIGGRRGFNRIFYCRNSFCELGFLGGFGGSYIFSVLVISVRFRIR